MAYLPLPFADRDRVNDYLRAMAARGFGCTVEGAIRSLIPSSPLNWGRPS